MNLVARAAKNLRNSRLIIRLMHQGSTDPFRRGTRNKKAPGDTSLPTLHYNFEID